MIEFVTTRDGSPTIYDPVSGEHHHSLIGAYTEALTKFVRVSSSIIDRLDRIRVLDLPFGLGYNLATLIAEYPQKFFACTAIELDREVIRAISRVSWNDLLQPFACLSAGKQRVQGANFSLNLLIEDLRQQLPRLSGAFDLIYYDPFSPRVAPELWSTAEVLSPLARLLDPSGLLITYTASNKVRRGLRDLGLNVAPSVAVGRRMPGTIASWRRLESAFSPETEAKITAAKPY